MSIKAASIEAAAGAGKAAALVLHMIAEAGIALGVSVTGGTGAMLLALSLVPAFLILMLWPGRPAPTIAEVLHNGKRRR